MTTKQHIINRRKKWADALRSGKYKQGRYALHKKYADGADAYCCLGVACDLFKDEVGGLSIVEMAPPPEATEVKRVRYDGADQYLPKKIAEYLNIDIAGCYKEFGSLTSVNDSGVPFTEIADIIESDRLQDSIKLEDESMATMMDVAGQADLTDDDVYETLEELINLGQPFTAYDVTQALRAAGFWAEHSSVRDIVTGYAQREGLQHKNMEVRPGIWARQYVPAPKVAVTAPTPSQVVIPPATTNGVVVKGTAGQSSGVKLHPTKRGGVGIPKGLVMQIAKRFQAVTVKDNGVIRLTRYDLGEKSNYTVDSGNRIVVTAATLRKLGLNKDSVYARVVGETLELKGS